MSEKQEKAKTWQENPKNTEFFLHEEENWIYT